MEKIEKTIVTNPLFKEIAEVCWQEANGTDEMENVEVMANYTEFIPKAAQRLSQRPSSPLSSEEARTLWREMLKTGLAFCERTEGINWKKTLINPKRFIWKITQKPRYRWLATAQKKVTSYSEPASTAKSKEESFEISSGTFFKEEFVATQSRIQALEEKRRELDQEKTGWRS